MNYFNNKKGFTLIELLVVIAIIGIIAGIVLQTLSSARDKSQNATRLANIDQLDKSLQLHLTKTTGASFPSTGGSLPSGVWQCVGLSSGTCWAPPAYPPASTLNAALIGNISAVPKDPSIPAGANGDYYLYNSTFSGARGNGAYLMWVTTSTGSCGRGYQYATATGFQTCALYLGSN